MDARELRIDSYVLFAPKGRGKTKIEPRVCRVIKIDQKGVVVKDLGLDLVLKFYSDELKPIPLDEEWLSRCIFKLDDNGSWWVDLQTHYLELIPSADGYFYPVYAQLPELSSEEEQRLGLHRIKYLHELQNLFYTLRHEEMEILPL